MDLSNLKGPLHNRRRKRVGRGESSGLGKTCGKGHKGQKSRTSPNIDPGFEGGQMPLQRRLPKKGFSNAPFKTRYNVINVAALEGFEPETDVTPELLRQKGLIKRKGPVKLLGNGEISQALTVRLERVSGSARSKIEAAGGKVEELRPL
jgi:large subunit ribosomal protein L15